MQHVSEVWQQENLHQVNHNSRVKRQNVSVRPASSQIYCLLSVCTCIPPPQNVGLKLSSIFFTALTVSFCESVTKYEIIFWIISDLLVSQSTENYSGCFRYFSDVLSTKQLIHCRLINNWNNLISCSLWSDYKRWCNTWVVLHVNDFIRCVLHLFNDSQTEVSSWFWLEK